MKRRKWKRIVATTAIGAVAVASATAMIAPEPVREIIFMEPEWRDLSLGQQKILQPLAGKWSGMKNVERKKWLGVAEHYAELSPAEQKRVQHRMEGWSDATPSQRQAARKEYARIKAKAPEEKDKFAEAYRHYLASKAAAEANAPAAPEAEAAPKPEPPPAQTAQAPAEETPKP